MRAHGARARDVCAMMCDDAMRKLVVFVRHRASRLIKKSWFKSAYDDRMQTFAALAMYIDDASTRRDDTFSRRHACMHAFEISMLS